MAHKSISLMPEPKFKNQLNYTEIEIFILIDFYKSQLLIFLDFPHCFILHTICFRTLGLWHFKWNFVFQTRFWLIGTTDLYWKDNSNKGLCPQLKRRQNWQLIILSLRLTSGSFTHKSDFALSLQFTLKKYFYSLKWACLMRTCLEIGHVNKPLQVQFHMLILHQASSICFWYDYFSIVGEGTKYCEIGLEYKWVIRLAKNTETDKVLSIIQK